MVDGQLRFTAPANSMTVEQWRTKQRLLDDEQKKFCLP